VIQHITTGDCYQVNLAQRFEATVENGSAWSSYKLLRQHNPAPFAGFMKHPCLEIMCLSPERFIQNINGNIESKPIKGTRARNDDPVIDKRFATELLSSEKDCAENTMIVDLVRNDMGKNCEVGSIAVPKLHALESFSSVHHLVSTITGKLLKGRHSLDLLKGCFPGGSITGAPKIRAMELIESLEPHRRALYCGTMGYIDWNGNMDMNIVIRTLFYTPANQKLYCYAGGALIADSKVEEEYQESMVKVSKILKLWEVA
jgi:para-aminobenzoate synthetase component 1